MYFRAFFWCREIRSKNVLKVPVNYRLIDKVRAPLAWTIELAFTNCSAKRSRMLFLAGNTNKALSFTATFAVLDSLDAITSRCQRSKLRDLKSAIEEATEI